MPGQPLLNKRRPTPRALLNRRSAHQRARGPCFPIPQKLKCMNRLVDAVITCRHRE